MLVRRLTADQTQAVIRDLAPLGLERHRIPEPVSGAAIEASSVPLVTGKIGRAYGLFDDAGGATGVLVGIIVPEPMTGVRVGIEHVWWCVPGVNGLPLLREFEADCRYAGCARVIFGYSPYEEGYRMEKIYGGLGYEPYLVSVSKQL